MTADVSGGFACQLPRTIAGSCGNNAESSKAQPRPPHKRKYSRPSEPRTSSATATTSFCGRVTPIGAALNEGPFRKLTPPQKATRNQDTGDSSVAALGTACCEAIKDEGTCCEAMQDEGTGASGSNMQRATDGSCGIRAVSSNTHPRPSPRRKYTRPSAPGNSATTATTSSGARMPPVRFDSRNGASLISTPPRYATRNQETDGIGSGAAQGHGVPAGIAEYA